MLALIAAVSHASGSAPGDDDDASTDARFPNLEPRTPAIEFRRPLVEPHRPNIERSQPGVEFRRPNIEPRRPAIERGPIRPGIREAPVGGVGDSQK